MKTARSILHATALGLVAFTFVASLTVGVTAPATQISFGLLVVYGVIEIALVSYAPRPVRRRTSSLRSITAQQTAPAIRRAPAAVEYPNYRKAA